MSDTARYQLHRSFTFWTGVALFLSLSFAWWYSWRDVVALRHGPLTLMHASGGLTITRNPLQEKSWDFLRTPPSPEVQNIRRSFFPRPYSVAGRDLAASGIKVQPRTLEQWHRGWIAAYPTNVSLTFVPDWLIAIALLLPWAALVTWRLCRGVEAGPLRWVGEERETGAPQVASRPTPPPVPHRPAFEASDKRSIWANLVPRRIPGSPWAHSGIESLTDTPMPFRRES